MDPVTIGELLGGMGELAPRLSEEVCRGVAIDSRKISPGDLFFALRGERHDGHAFVGDALAAGAAAAVVADGAAVQGGQPEERLVRVPDTLRALQQAAARYRARREIPVLGITGSHGKTTTKDVLASLLTARYSVCKTPKNFNGQIGLPLALFQLERSHEVLVVEMGISEPGEMDVLVGIARPTHGALLCIAPVHTEFLGDLEGVLAEKIKLLHGLPPSGEAFVGADDPLVVRAAESCAARVWSVGASKAADFRWFPGPVGEDGRAAFALRWKGGELTARLPLLGRHNAANAAFAAAMALRLGLTAAEVAAGLERLSPSPQRMALAVREGIQVIDDAYNAAPQSMRAALRTLAELPGVRHRYAALGDMLELGPREAEMHRELGSFLAGLPLDGIVLHGPRSREIARGALEAGFPARSIHQAATHQEAADALRSLLQPGDALLVKGSRGVRMERVIELLFDAR